MRALPQAAASVTRLRPDDLDSYSALSADLKMKSGLASTPRSISIPRPRALEGLLHDRGELPTEERIQDAQFKIRLANTEGRRSKADVAVFLEGHQPAR